MILAAFLKIWIYASISWGWWCQSSLIQGRCLFTPDILSNDDCVSRVFTSEFSFCLEWHWSLKAGNHKWTSLSCSIFETGPLQEFLNWQSVGRNQWATKFPMQELLICMQGSQKAKSVCNSMVLCGHYLLDWTTADYSRKPVQAFKTCCPNLN